MTTTLNSADKSASITLTNGDLTFASTGAAVTYFCVRSTAIISASQKVYFELLINKATAGQTALGVGIGNSTASLSAFPGNDTNSFGYYTDTGEVFFNGVVTSTVAASTGGAIVRFCWDEANKRLWVAVNGSNWNNGTTADPVAGTGSIGIATLAGASGTHYVICTSANPSNADQGTMNFDPSSWSFPAPEGYAAMGGTIYSVSITETLGTISDRVSISGAAFTQAWQPNGVDIYPQAASGTVYNVDITESIGTIAEDQSAVLTISVSITENIGTIAETQAGPLTIAASRTESIGTISETQSGPLTMEVARTESIGTIAETVSATGTFGHSITESIGTIAEDQSITLTLAASITENIGTIAESPSSQQSFQVSLTETVGTISEAQSATGVFGHTVSESIGTIAESQSIQMTMAPTITENIGTIAEAQSVQMTMAPSITESVGTIAETQVAQVTMAGAVTENVGTLAESTSATGVFGHTITETMSLTDTQTVTGGGGSTAAYELGGATVAEQFTPAGTLQQPDYLNKKTRGS